MAAIDYEAIKRDATLWMLLEALGWRPAWREGNRARGPCPIHGSASPSSRSFAVHGEDWFCHKCSFGGGSIELVIRLERLSAYDAAFRLCELTGARVTYIPRAGRTPAPRNRKTER